MYKNNGFSKGGNELFDSGWSQGHLHVLIHKMLSTINITSIFIFICENIFFCETR